MFKTSYDMKKLFAGLALLLPVQLMAADDSVYSWGSWAQGVMPAAGNVTAIAPAPARKPDINFRPNEAAVFGRQIQVAQNTPVPTPAPAVAPTPTVATVGTPAAGDPRSRGR